MEKYFCNYKQALALKELGFDMPCIATYTEGAIGNGNDLQWFVSPLEGVNKDFTFVAAPLKSQVFEWFREKHQLFGVVLCDLCWNISGGVANDYGDAYDWDSERYETYEEAESACIDKLIELIKQKL